MWSLRGFSVRAGNKNMTGSLYWGESIHTYKALQLFLAFSCILSQFPKMQCSHQQLEEAALHKGADVRKISANAMLPSSCQISCITAFSLTPYPNLPNWCPRAEIRHKVLIRSISTHLVTTRDRIHHLP